MQRLEVSGAVRPIYGSLGFKRLRNEGSVGWGIAWRGYMKQQLLSVQKHLSLTLDRLWWLIMFWWPMYLGLVFFTDISCHKTGAGLTPCASLLLEPFSTGKLHTGTGLCTVGCASTKECCNERGGILSADVARACV